MRFHRSRTCAPSSAPSSAVSHRGCEVSAVAFNQRHLLVSDGAAESIMNRRKIYAKARVDMQAVYAGGVSLVEHVRGACLLAARKMAASVATMAAARSPFVPGGAGASSIRWTGGGPLNWPGSSYTGRPRIAVEFGRDSIVLLLASYFVLVPAGCTVVESEPER